MADLNKITVYVPMTLSTQDADKPSKMGKSDKLMFTLTADATVGDFFKELSNLSGISAVELIAFYEEKGSERRITLDPSNHNKKLAHLVPKESLKDGHFKLSKVHRSPEKLY